MISIKSKNGIEISNGHIIEICPVCEKRSMRSTTRCKKKLSMKRNSVWMCESCLAQFRWDAKKKELRRMSISYRGGVVMSGVVAKMADEDEKEGKYGI